MRSCLVVGKHRREFDETAEVAGRLLTSDNLVEMQRVAALAREMLFGLTGPRPAGVEVLEQLEDRIDLLLQQRVAQSLRACTNCTGSVFRISKEHDVGLGRGRVVVCAGCGLVSTFVTRVDELSDQFGPPVEAPAHGRPFR